MSKQKELLNRISKSGKGWSEVMGITDTQFGNLKKGTYKLSLKRLDQIETELLEQLNLVLEIRKEKR